MGLPFHIKHFFLIDSDLHHNKVLCMSLGVSEEISRRHSAPRDIVYAPTLEILQSQHN